MTAKAKALLVLCTAGKKAQAEKIARALVQERLAACVNVLPHIHSHYRWQGKVQSDPETLMLIKTTPRRLAALTKRIQALHSYTIPEVIALPITGGSAAYLRWLLASTR